jgi:uncharacterized membrane protein YcaP (DUF421 family)
MDWPSIFELRTPVLEIFVRGSVMYLMLFLLLRVVVKRETGTTGTTDLLVLVLIADAAQNAMAGEYTSITDGLILVAVIIGWSYLLDFLALRSRTAAKLIRPRPLRLIRDGKVMHRNLRQEMVRPEELEGLLREQGIEDVDEVWEAWMESDGQFSVITRETHSHSRAKQRKKETI